MLPANEIGAGLFGDTCRWSSFVVPRSPVHGRPWKHPWAGHVERDPAQGLRCMPRTSAGGDPLCQKASRDVHCGYYETCTVHISNSTSPITTEMSKGACQKKPGATIKPHFEWIFYVFLPWFLRSKWGLSSMSLLMALFTASPHRYHHHGSVATLLHAGPAR
jgi:hypothetical protein